MFPEVLWQNLRRPTLNLQCPHEGHPDLLPRKMLIRRKPSLLLPCTSGLPCISSILQVGAEHGLLLCERWKWPSAPAKSPMQEVQHCRAERFPVYLLENWLTMTQSRRCWGTGWGSSKTHHTYFTSVCRRKCHLSSAGYTFLCEAVSV